jgi:hypothetical protein
MVKLKLEVERTPYQHLEDFRQSFPGVVNKKGILSLCVGKEVFSVKEFKLESTSNNIFEASIPQGWDRIYVTLAGKQQSILIPKKISSKINLEIEALPLLQELEEIYFVLKNTPSDKSFNTFSFLKIRQKIQETPELRENKNIKELLDVITEELKSHRLYDLGKPDIPNVGIGFVNGICNDFKNAWISAEYISKLSGGCNVYSTYNETNGIFYDLVKCAKGLYHIKSKPVYLLHKMWGDFFEKSSPDAKFLMICHSQGAIHVRNALEAYSPELRKRIVVIAVAPGAYINPAHCAKVYHYRASGWKDIVPMIDGSGQVAAKDTVNVLSSDPEAALFDHTFRSPTYQLALKEKLDQYLSNQL